MNKIKNAAIAILVLVAATGCAILHHVQVGEVDSKVVLRGERFEILISETGFNFEEAADVAKALSTNKNNDKNIQQIQDIIGLFQMGPRTGNPVFTDEYADLMYRRIKQECPRGRVSGLVSIRETAKYPVVSGEIVKIVGYCRRVKRG